MIIDFYIGLLSESRGLVLCVATVLHLLFYVDKEDEEIPSAMSKDALTAEIDFVQLACQQTAYVVGRGRVEEEVQKFMNSLLIFALFLQWS